MAAGLCNYNEASGGKLRLAPTKGKAVPLAGDQRDKLLQAERHLMTALTFDTAMSRVRPCLCGIRSTRFRQNTLGLECSEEILLPANAITENAEDLEHDCRTG